MHNVRGGKGIPLRVALVLTAAARSSPEHGCWKRDAPVIHLTFNMWVKIIDDVYQEALLSLRCVCKVHLDVRLYPPSPLLLYSKP